jgi:hypothetical protein
VFVRGKAGDGVETLKEWYDRTASGARGSLHPHLPGARIWIDEHRYACEDDHVVVWLETDKGCWGPGFHANWCSPAWEVIKTAIELAARHVGELVACGTAKAPAAIESGLHP